MRTTGKIIRAERFEVVDQAGNVRATLGPNGAHTQSLTFYDLATATPRAGIGFSTEGGRSILQLIGPGSTVGLVVEEDGTAKVVLESRHGQKIGLGLTPDGMAMLSFFDAASVLRASVMLEAEKEDGRLGLILRNERSQGQPCQPTASPGDTPPRKGRSTQKRTTTP
jgi:hypothetical protein